MEWAGGLERLLKVFRACTTPARLRSGHLGGIVAIAEVDGGLDFPAEVGLDHLLASGILGGNIQELLCCAWGLAIERLVGRATDEDVDHISICDVGELVALLGEALDVLPEGLVGPSPVVAEVP